MGSYIVRALRAAGLRCLRIARCLQTTAVHGAIAVSWHAFAQRQFARAWNASSDVTIYEVTIASWDCSAYGLRHTPERLDKVTTECMHRLLVRVPICFAMEFVRL